MPIRIVYRRPGPSGHLLVTEETFGDTQEAQDEAEILIRNGFGDVEVMLDLDTADQTARAMAFTLPVVGKAGYGTWRE